MGRNAFVFRNDFLEPRCMLNVEVLVAGHAIEAEGLRQGIDGTASQSAGSGQAHEASASRQHNQGKLTD